MECNPTPSPPRRGGAKAISLRAYPSGSACIRSRTNAPPVIANAPTRRVPRRHGSGHNSGQQAQPPQHGVPAGRAPANCAPTLPVLHADVARPPCLPSGGATQSLPAPSPTGLIPGGQRILRVQIAQLRQPVTPDSGPVGASHRMLVRRFQYPFLPRAVLRVGASCRCRRRSCSAPRTLSATPAATRLPSASQRARARSQQPGAEESPDHHLPLHPGRTPGCSCVRTTSNPVIEAGNRAPLLVATTGRDHGLERALPSSEPIRGWAGRDSRLVCSASGQVSRQGPDSRHAGREGPANCCPGHR